jgi:hypothetical protein
MLIKRIYNADPLLCPKCGGTMKIISFMEAHQQDAIRKLLTHCGLWREPFIPPPRAPPKPAKKSGSSTAESSSVAETRGPSVEIDPDYLEHLHREKLDQPELPWD